MGQLQFLRCLLLIAVAIGCAFSQGTASRPHTLPRQNLNDVIDSTVSAAKQNPPVKRFCPKEPLPHTVEIREADPQINKQHHDLMRRLLIKSVAIPNTTILLGPNVVLDFSDASDDDIPLDFGPCVTLTSTTTFRSDTNAPRARSARTEGPDRAAARTSVGTTVLGEQPARTPHSLGPLLKFGRHRSDEEKVFLSIACPATFQPNDNVRISGFRLYGPSFGQQSVDDIGIQVVRCVNIEISNMEIAGWGGQGIQVVDDPEQGPGQEPPNNRPGDRIGRPDQIRIFNNYIHNNQHPRSAFNGHTAGYGVEINHGAWGQVYQNVFDFNRHAISAEGDTGGYDALRNLVLKGGGLHYELLGIYTHQFDIHGSGENGFGGQAGVQFSYSNNSFQYLADNAIKVRGRPHFRIYIDHNVFAHEGRDDAIAVNDTNDLDVIEIRPNNSFNFDSYGRYGVCDFDGDGVDDLFLATGQTWWFSSFGEFQWTYLSDRTERLNQVRLGYFDNDKRCDVLTESNGQWVIASGGTGPWRSIGAFGAPLSDVAFGQFDPNIRDHRAGVTRRTTHAFWRTQNGQWKVTPLSAPAWHDVQSSSFPMSNLRFGDFTGDGVTDVLAVEGGRWSISESANGSWQRLNQYLADDVSSLFIADLNNNNIDDLIRLERTELRSNGMITEIFTWWVSDDGRSRWRKLKTYTLTHPQFVSVPPTFAYAGRFGAAPGGGVLLIDHNRVGRFYSEAEIAAHASPDWKSLFPY